MNCTGRRLRRIVAMALVAATLTACGYKGSLTLPASQAAVIHLVSLTA